MTGECVRFLFTSCEELQTKTYYKRTNHEVICLLYLYWDTTTFAPSTARQNEIDINTTRERHKSG